MILENLPLSRYSASEPHNLRPINQSRFDDLWGIASGMVAVPPRAIDTVRHTISSTSPGTTVVSEWHLRGDYPPEIKTVDQLSISQGANEIEREEFEFFLN